MSLFFFAVIGAAALAFLLNELSKLRTGLKKLSDRIDNLNNALERRGVGGEKKFSPPPQAPVERKVVAPPPPVARPEIPVRIPEPPPPPRPPAPPNPVVEAVRHFFTGGNLVVRIGLIVLFFGITFLLKLAIDQGLLPIELRLAAVAAGALALIVFGWRLRAKRPGYALSLLGGGVAVLYLDIFAAFRLYHLIPSSLAFGLLLLVVVFSSFIAVALRAQAVAVIGLCGGFLAPVLTSTGGGSHVALFSYFLILNLGILGIAWFRAWRFLNLLGFFFTFTLGTAWGGKYYRPELFSTTEPFLIVFFLFYSIIPILFASRVRTNLKGFVDTALVFGTPLVAFSLQTQLVRNIPHGLAWSSLALALYYIALAFFLKKRSPATYKALTEAMLALGVIFVTLTIPLRLSHQWTSLSWAIEGAALVWIGLRQGRLLARLFGVLVLIGSCFAFRTPPEGLRGALLINPYFVGGLFIALGHLFASFQLARHRDKLRAFEAPLEILLFVIGLGWWFYTGIWEIGDQLDARKWTPYVPNAQMFFVVLSLVACEALHRRLSWRLLSKPAYLLLPALGAFFAFFAFDYGFRPSANFGWILWPLGLVAHFWFLKRIDRPDLNVYEKILHAAGLFLLVEVLTFESARQFFLRFKDVFFDPESSDTRAYAAGYNWASVVGHFWGVLAMIVVAFFRDKVRWPLKAHEKTYLELGLTPIAILLWIWIFRSLRLDGASGLVPYLPLFNPLELLQGFFFLAAIAWVRSVSWPFKKFLYFVLGLTIFVWINALLARSVSHWTGLPYEAGVLFDSLVFQTSLTIYWAVLAMTVMVVATRKGLRGAWVVGATLLGLTVLKLFFVDLSKTQTIARVVSFVGAGVLILAIGYFSPMPPKRKKEAAT